jgi:hypothetical protein
MSIHAELSPEAKARLNRENRKSTILSIVVSVLMIGLVALVLGIFFIPSFIKESPTIVTYQGDLIQDDKPEIKKVNTAVMRKPSAPSSSSAKVIASKGSSNVSIPVIDTPDAPEAVEFGDGDSFGEGWGDGSGFGDGGGGASFFNQNVKADSVAYVIDYSLSMKGERESLMRAELTKSVSDLPSGIKYQLVFFSGPGWVAGSEVKSNYTGGTGLVKGERGHEYKWKGKGLNDWLRDGKKQPVEWLTATSKQLEETLKDVKETPLSGGTDWREPLAMVFEMEPPPQVVYFMTDGIMGEHDMVKLAKDLARDAKSKDIVVNTIALLQPQAEEALFELAQETGGVFTIVEAGGKARQVDGLGKKKAPVKK